MEALEGEPGQVGTPPFSGWPMQNRDQGTWYCWGDDPGLMEDVVARVEFGLVVVFYALDACWGKAEATQRNDARGKAEKKRGRRGKKVCDTSRGD